LSHQTEAPTEATQKSARREKCLRQRLEEP
jgi:hypothetical protein